MAIKATDLLKVQMMDLNLFYFLFHFIFLLIFPKFIFFSFSLFLNLDKRYNIMIYMTVTVTQLCDIKNNIKTIY